MKEQPSLRFDHREIAVIFSLFVFVSLLMFTVGILVGKGLAQARYEGLLLKEAHRTHTAEAPPPVASTAQAPESQPAPAQEAAAPTEPQRNPEGEKTAAVETKPSAEAKKDEPLKLVPQRGRQPDLYGNSLQEPKGDQKETDHILKNPKLKGLFDEEPGQKRGTASVPKIGGSKKFPPSFAQGKFTVQVGSYPTEKDAAERVESLKKLGFPHAYFTAKELGEKKDTWYRVWLGYFPDLPSAQRSGEMLQEKEEVKNYLVRKTDSEN